jgi:heme/copper-type cytochrome/quinol oxidase subunit 3
VTATGDRHEVAPPTLDVSGVPSHAFGHRAPLWWGVLLLVAIEATTMALLLVSHLYLRGNYDVWPPSPIGGPAFRLATIQAILLGVSYLPMMLAVRAARAERLVPTRRWLTVAALLGATMLAVRWLEFQRLPFRWDDHAYGSVFWMVLGLHVTHVLTGVLEDGMVIALFLRGPVERKHFGDVEASALLWYFSVLEWIPGFAILYLAPWWAAR